MNTNTITLPAKISRETLVKRAGTNVPPVRVQFEGPIFDGTRGFARNPIESIQAYGEAVTSAWEPVERSESFPGFTLDELAVALDIVLNLSTEGVPQVISRSPLDTPSTRRVPIGYDMRTGEMQYRIVPDGAMSLPGFRKVGKTEAWIVVQLAYGIPTLTAYTIRDDQPALEGVFAYIRDYARAHSIYLGQAVDTNFEFINLSRFKPENVALTQKIEKAIQLYVESPFTDQVRLDERNQSPKTGLMFEGPPGGGKTMTVTLCEYIAVAKGGAVIHVDPSLGVEGLERANMMASRLLEAGHHVMITFEDMEKLAHQSRAKVLEILDGGGSKTTRRIIVGTTNFIEQIDRAMLRPGRFDAVLHCGLPDQQAFEHLIKVLISEADLGDIDYAEAFPAFEGYSYATIANAVSIIVRSAIVSGRGTELDTLNITTSDLITAADMVRDHHNLLCEEVKVEAITMDSIFRDVVAEYASNVESAVDEYTTRDNTDYEEIDNVVANATDRVVESRIHQARIMNNDGDEKFRISTN